MIHELSAEALEERAWETQQKAANSKFKPHRCTVPVLQFNKVRGRRFYPLALADILLSYRNIYHNRGMIGCMDDTGTTIISLSKASHLVLDLRLEGEMLLADIETIQTPNGKFLTNLLVECPKAVEFKPRGLMKVCPGIDYDEVVDFSLVTIDAYCDECGSD